MRNIYRFTLLSIVCLFCLSSYSPAQENIGESASESTKRPIFVGVAPISDARLDDDYINSAVDFFERRVGRKVVLTVLGDMFAVMEAIERNSLDMAFVSALAASQVLESGSGVYLGTRLTAFNSPFYRLLFIAPRDSGISSLSDLRGKRIAFPDRFSTAAYVFSRNFLSRRGLVTGDRELYTPVFYKNFDEAIEACLRGETEAAFAYEETYARHRSGSRLLAASFEEYPNSAFVANPRTLSTGEIGAFTKVLKEFEAQDKHNLLRFEKIDATRYRLERYLGE